MFKEKLILGMLAETALHPGSDRPRSGIDLPVQREEHTGFPIIQASGLKGAMREKAEVKGMDSALIEIIFGPENAEHAGALALTEARLLAFPVRSLSGVFVWITCPTFLNRYLRNLKMLDASPSLPPFDTFPELTADKAFVLENSGLSDPLVLEDLLFHLDATKSNEMKQWQEEIQKLLPEDSSSPHRYIREKFRKHLVLIDDESAQYLTRYGTQVTARNVLDENKTSKNLWYEETLPPDSVFYCLALFSDPRTSTSYKATALKTVFSQNIPPYLQIGGDETLGEGWLYLRCREV
jgi:CRISPR-associated protein Cmr4